MAILSTRIQDYIGSFADTTALTDMANEVAKDIIHTAPPEMYPFFSNQVSFTSSAVYSESEALVNAKIFNVRLVAADGVERPCREIPPALAGRAGDTLEMIYATETDPVFYIKDAKINALPASKTVRFSAINYPTIDLTQSAIANFPNEAEHIVVLGTSAKAILRMISDEIDNMQGLTISMVVYPSMSSMPSVPSISPLSISATPPSSVASPSFTYNNIDAKTSTAQTTSIGVVPVYTSQSVVLTGVPSVPSFVAPSIPATPSSPDLSYSSFISETTTA